jgi:hypothetical protein
MMYGSDAQSTSMYGSNGYGPTTAATTDWFVVYYAPVAVATTITLPSPYVRARRLRQQTRLWARGRFFPLFPAPSSVAPLPRTLSPRPTTRHHLVHRMRCRTPGRWLAGSGRRACGRRRPTLPRLVERARRARRAAYSILL